MVDDKPLDEPRASRPGRAMMTPRERFGYNDPPNAHISRDPPFVLQAASDEIPVPTATTVAPTGVSVTGTIEPPGQPGGQSAQHRIVLPFQTNSEVAVSTQRTVNTAAFQSTPNAETLTRTPLPLSGSAKAAFSARGVLTLTPEP